MGEIIHECIKVQFEYSNIPLQDRVYIAFGRITAETEKAYGIHEIFNLINSIKSELKFLEEVWNGENRKS